MNRARLLRKKATDPERILCDRIARYRVGQIRDRRRSAFPTRRGLVVLRF